MKTALTQNIELAPKNKAILKRLLKKASYPVGIYRNKKDVYDGIKFYNGLIKRKGGK